MKIMIKQFREEKGLTQRKVANMVGVSRQTINAVENGKYSPTVALAYKLVKVFDKKYIEELFIEDENE